MKIIERDRLIIRQSMNLPFNNTEIWGEELDALSVYTDVVKEKFLKDMEIIKKQSSPSLIAVHLNETLVDSELVELIVTELVKAGKSVRKVVFVGLDKQTEKMFKAMIKKRNAEYSFYFIDDYEKGKQWLTGK